MGQGIPVFEAVRIQPRLGLYVQKGTRGCAEGAGSVESWDSALCCPGEGPILDDSEKSPDGARRWAV